MSKRGLTKVTACIFNNLNCTLQVRVFLFIMGKKCNDNISTLVPLKMRRADNMAPKWSKGQFESGGSVQKVDCVVDGRLFESLRYNPSYVLSFVVGNANSSGILWTRISDFKQCHNPTIDWISFKNHMKIIQEGVPKVYYGRKPKLN